MSPRIAKSPKDRLEMVMQLLAFTCMWNITFTFLVTNVRLILERTANMLFPFQVVISQGFIFWTGSSVFSVYLQLREKKLASPITLCIKIISTVASFATMFFALPSTFNLKADVILDIPLEPSIYLAFCAGIFAMVAGLLMSIYHIPKVLFKD